MNRWKGKPTVPYPYYSMINSNKKEWATDTVAKWMNLKIIMLREWSSTKKVIPFTWNSRKRTENYDQKGDPWLAEDWRTRRDGKKGLPRVIKNFLG